MALLQISEPGGKPSEPAPRRRAVGIDLGTTNSLVATRCGQAIETLPDAAGHHLLPSIVRYEADRAPQVGSEAKSSLTTDPGNTLASVKRLLGRSRAEILAENPQLPFDLDPSAAEPRILTAAGPRTPMEVSADILSALRARAEHFLAGPLDGAVITVPAYFNDAQRQQTRDAARLAGLTVLRLLNEPTAAAVAYGLDSGEQGTVVVFDLGGGTFDVSILRLEQGVFQVLATGGDTRLGGDDFDSALADWLLRESGAPADAPAPRDQWAQLLALANDTRHRLSEVAEVTVPLGVRTLTVTREVLAQCCQPLVDKTLRTCRRVLRDAELTVEDVDTVVMVGGATRMPLIRQVVEAFFGKPPLVSIDPDKVVAIGAGIQADVLVGNKGPGQFLLLDVNPLSLGVETMGELVEKIIPRNTTLPVSRAQEFTTFKDGQTAMSIHVVQGERELVSECRSLARFTLRGIPPMVAGAAKVRVTFQVDADGLLNVSATELATGTHAEIQVKPSYGLSSDLIEDMLLQSHAHAAEDKRLRALREAQVEGRQLLDALAAALAADGQGLSADESVRIDAVRTALAAALEGDDVRVIHELTEKLNHVTEPFAARRMDLQIQQALRGASINAMES